MRCPCDTTPGCSDCGGTGVLPDFPREDEEPEVLSELEEMEDSGICSTCGGEGVIEEPCRGCRPASTCCGPCGRLVPCPECNPRGGRGGYDDYDDPLSDPPDYHVY